MPLRLTHLLSHLFTYFGITAVDDTIQHESSLQWLQENANKVVDKTLLLRPLIRFYNLVDRLCMQLFFSTICEKLFVMKMVNTLSAIGNCGSHIFLALGGKTTPEKQLISFVIYRLIFPSILPI